MKQLILFILLFFSINTFSQDFPLTPKTTGSLCTTLDRDYERLRYEERIPYCYRNVKRELKTRIYKDYGIDLNRRREFTVDHIIPLSIGGNNHPDNLFPQHKSIHTGKYEYEIYRMMEEGTITQKLAIRVLMMKKFDPYRSWNDIKREVLGN